jgi:peptide methionine sulfoxide reductase MsrB
VGRFAGAPGSGGGTLELLTPFVLSKDTTSPVNQIEIIHELEGQHLGHLFPGVPTNGSRCAGWSASFSAIEIKDLLDALEKHLQMIEELPQSL